MLDLYINIFYGRRISIVLKILIKHLISLVSTATASSTNLPIHSNVKRYFLTKQCKIRKLFRNMIKQSVCRTVKINWEFLNCLMDFSTNTIYQ